MTRDKAVLVFAGEPLLVRVVRAASAACERTVVVAGPDQELPPVPAGVRVVRDERQHEGPLVAFVRGMDALGAETSHAFVCGTDAPLLVPSLVRRLAALIGDRDAAVPVVGATPQVLCAVYAVRVGPAARRLVQSGARSLRRLVDEVDALRISPEELLEDEALRADDPELSSLLDVDTPEDYELLSRRCSK
jgi:molybdopterin-guanine dinucleotide biosynthesis protein A